MGLVRKGGKLAELCIEEKMGGDKLRVGWGGEAEGCNTDYMTNSVTWVLDPYLTLSSVEGTRRQQKPANDLNKW